MAQGATTLTAHRISAGSSTGMVVIELYLRQYLLLLQNREMGGGGQCFPRQDFGVPAVLFHRPFDDFADEFFQLFPWR